MENSNKSNFCIRPFNSIVVSTDGSLRPCCQIKQKNFNIKTSTIKEYWNNEYLSQLRKKFLDNEKPNECENCWNMENQNLQSHRIESNFEYKTIFKKKYEKNLKLLEKNNLEYPEDIELSVTNICNLACQMCSGKDSSKLLIENNYLNFENLKQSDYNLHHKMHLQIKEIVKHDLKLLNLRGGEPLVNKIIIEIIEKLATSGRAKDMTLHITTNGTACNNRILNLLGNFKKIKIMLSMESIGRYNDYLRYPSHWPDIEKNILQFKSLKNVYLYINTTIQNLNLLYLEPLIEFANKHKIFLNFNILLNPQYLTFENLPLDLLTKSYKKLLEIDKKKLIHTRNINEIIILLRDTINNYKFDVKKFNMFTNMIKKRDQYRKISIADYMPEIYNII
jgi:radical SAM protein with 4Fe4S-binding SPASM domain